VNLVPPRAPLPSALAVFVLVLLLAALDVVARWEPNTWINRDGRFYTNVNATLVESASFEQSEFCASWYDGEQGWNRNLDASWSNVALGREGRRYPKHPVLLPLLSTPLFWAFGVFGNLLFNLFAFALAGVFAFELARRHAPPLPSALAATAFLLATGIRDYAYDYHVDVLLLALFLAGVVALGRGRGVLGGVLLAACVTLKPTVLLWVPALALFVEPRARRAPANVPRDARPAPLASPAAPGAAHVVLSAPGAAHDARVARTSEVELTRAKVLLRAVLGGAVVLALFALANTAFFGRPWWAGYNRVLVVVAGEAQVADVSGSFDVAWDRGLSDLWSGPHGIRDRLTLALYAVPALALLWRRPRLVVAALYAIVTGVVLFARYRWYADRFLWPAFALVVPALAVLIARAPRLVTFARSRAAIGASPALGVGLACAMLVTATLPGGGPIEHRLPDDAWTLGAEALAQGELAMVGPHAIEIDGRPVPRQAPLATLVAAPFAKAGGRYGLLVLHALLAGVLGAALTRIAERSHRAASIAGVLPVAILFAFPGVASRVMSGGPELLAAASGFGALALVRESVGSRRVETLRSVLVGALASMATFVGGALWPFAIVALVLARGRRVPVALGIVLGLGVGVLAHVAIAGLASAPHVPGLEAVPRTLSGAQLALLVAALLGVLFAPPRTSGIALALALAALSPGAPLDLVWLAALSLAAGPLVLAISRGLASTRLWSRRGRVLGVVVLALGLFAIGAVPRVAAWSEPLRFASYRGLREAKVKLGNAPCDFLNWQHMAWECSTKDQGVLGMVGLPVTLPVNVGGAPRELLRIPNQGPWKRAVTWRALPATSTLVVRWAVPDEVIAHGAVLVVRVGERDAESAPIERRVELPSPPDGRVYVERIDTSALVGRAVDVTLELEGRGATVAVDGGFE
jgi:hypothetical protein